jgi:hypothetical protein
MCDRCVELDGKIKHYERLATVFVMDRTTLDRIEEWVSKLRGEKAALHPEGDERPEVRNRQG